jgi:hypothetical protein
VERWFRVPDGLYQELRQLKVDSPYAFAAYAGQLRRLHEKRGRPDRAEKVASKFKPQCLGDWFYDRLADWSAVQPNGHVSPHVFRKTSLQFVRVGEDVNLGIALDAKVSATVLTHHYLMETDEQLRQKSNRTYQRILAGIPADLAKRYGLAELDETLERKIRAALAAKDWPAAAALTAQLAQQDRSPTG